MEIQIFKNLTPFFNQFLFALYYLIIIALIVKILLEQKDPAKTIAYILILLFLPFLGFFIYYFFGQNLRKEKLFNRKSFFESQQIKQITQKQKFDFHDNLSAIYPQLKNGVKLAQLLRANNKAFLSLNNKVSLIENGENAFPIMWDAIENAKEFIYLEFYRIAFDETGKHLFSLLEKKAKQGVIVKLIYDDVGSIDITKKIQQQLRKSGIDCYAFMPVRFPRFTSKINFRDHRKILIVDGKVAFTGGINIRNAYDNRLKNEVYWRDLNIKIEGEAVNSLQLLFAFNWYFVSNQMLEVKPQILNIETFDRKCPIQIAASGPDSDWPSIMQCFFEAINSAKKYIQIVTPYFVPNESIITALRTAALSGINVELMIPTNPDSKIAKAVSISYLGVLLEAGIKIFMYKRGMLHAKYFVVDGIFCSVGTANVDIRSFEYNFEVNSIIYQSEISSQLTQIFNRDKEGCFQITLEQWQNRPILKKIGQSIFRVIAPLV